MGVFGTQLESIGLSLLCYKPIIVPYTSFDPCGTFIGRFDHLLTDWAHTINITKGFSSASLGLSLLQSQVEEWLENGLGRHIELHNEAGVTIFEGFVNRIDATLGPLAYSIGPLTEIGNIVNVIYTPIDVSVDPPVRGSTTSTLAVTNDRSIARYGIFSKTLSAGECTDAEAEQYRDAWIAQNAWPIPTKDVSSGGGDAPKLQIEIAGYAEYLNLYDYANDSISYTTISDKIKAVLAAELNKMFSTDYKGIADNAFAVPESEPTDRQRMGWDVIKSQVELGDASDNRYAFGIYGGRKAKYFQISSSTITYTARLGDPTQAIYAAKGGAAVMPWNLLPGYWLQYTDLMAGRRSETDLHKDPRALLIEEVSYTAPWEWQIKGGNVATLPQLIAKLGYNG